MVVDLLRNQGFVLGGGSWSPGSETRPLTDVLEILAE